jgi:CubicO group peptidase (beta-lactamase class C family)
MRKLLVFSAIALAAPLAASAEEVCKPRDSWPTEAWPSKVAEYATSRKDQITALEEYLFKIEGTDAERKGRRTDGLVIVQGGSVVYERYGRGYKKGQKHTGWSVSKSVTAILTGIAVKQGKVALEDSICKHRTDLPEHACAIKIVHLLEFASGFDWKEIYENESNQMSSVLSMLYGQGHQDMALFTGSHPLRDAPGTSYQYSTGESTLLAGVVGKAMEPAFGADWPWKVLFDKVGMKRTTIERDVAGTFAGGSFVYASPEDWARFGWLLANDGCWNGERLLPADWMTESTKVSEPIKRKQVEREAGETQGRQFWLNKTVPGITNDEVPWPDAPPDSYCAQGHWGQRVCVVPSLDLVVARTADDRIREEFSTNEMLKLSIAVGRAP